MKPGGACFERIVALFGSSVLARDGSLDSGALGKIVLSDEKMLARLNSVVHPEVKDYIKNDIVEKEQQGVQFYILEAALLIQDGYRSICDEIWFIRSDEDVRIKRLISSRGYTEEKARSFIKNQPDDAYYEAGSDRVLDNNLDTENLRQNLIKLFDEIQ